MEGMIGEVYETETDLRTEGDFDDWPVRGDAMGFEPLVLADALTYEPVEVQESDHDLIDIKYHCD